MEEAMPARCGGGAADDRGRGCDHDDAQARAGQDQARRDPMRAPAAAQQGEPHPGQQQGDQDAEGAGGGPRYRMPDLAWVRDIRNRCVDQHVPVFFKQVGGPSPKAGERLLDGRTWEQYPATMTAG